MKSSRIPGFYKMTIEERREFLKENNILSQDELMTFSSNGEGSLPLEKADNMIENVVGTYPLPFGLGLNFLINEKEYIIPMVIEEPSVVASASFMAKIVRDAGGFNTEATDRVMIGQIQVVGCPDFEQAKAELLQAKDELIQDANAAHPSLLARGGGAEDLEVRILNEDSDSEYGKMLVLHLFINTCDAMGANTINTMVEALAPKVEQLTGGKVYLRILSNYADRCLAKATCSIPVELLETKEFTGEEVRDGIVHAYEFAASDPYRAVTHNKGIMNGIDPVVIATGNDWRAVEAAAHAHAARYGKYGSMTTWSVADNGNLVGELELPMAVGTVGGSIRIHPVSKLALDLLDVESAQELAQVIVAVGLAQNLGALRALATEGIQRGHMALHSRSVAMAAGATGEMIDVIANELIETNEIRVGKAKELVDGYSK